MLSSNVIQIVRMKFYGFRYSYPILKIKEC